MSDHLEHVFLRHLRHLLKSTTVN